MFIAYFSLLSVIMMVFSVCVNDLLYMLLFKAALVHHVTLCFWWLSVYYKDTDFSTSIDWYINIISVNDITVFNCKSKLKP